jgi:NodT family efflux transporter outer membrane factor (OMF) lipoprotein
VLVTLLGDVATNYVNYRTFEQRINYTQKNVELQRRTLKIVESRFKAGITEQLDVAQASSTLEQTLAQVEELEIGRRIAANQLCILLGIPPEDLDKRLGPGFIPRAPVDVAAGIPADLLRRRPDVRRAERQAAAQCAIIGVAESEFYPHIGINGTFSYQAAEFRNLFNEHAFAGAVGPTFTWNILNYGRILNNVRLQDARFQELVVTYQNIVLSAAQDVENGIVTFLRAQKRTEHQQKCVDDADTAVKISLAQYTAGTIDLTRVTLLQQTLVQQQDVLVQAKGEIALGLIQTYRALGGGWEIRRNGCTPGPLPPPGADAKPEELPTPKVMPTTPPKPVPNPVPPAPKPAPPAPLQLENKLLPMGADAGTIPQTEIEAASFIEERKSIEGQPVGNFVPRR